MSHVHPARRPDVIVRAYHRCKRWLKSKASAASLTDWLMAILTCAIVYLAWSGGRQTDKMIVAANKSAQAAQSFSESADRIRAETTKAVAEFGDMADANRTSAAAATSSSNTARNALEISERAYLGITAAQMDKDLAAGTNVKLSVFVANGGRTPAFNVHVRHYYRWGPPGVQKNLPLTKVALVSTSILLPGVQLLQASDQIAALPTTVIEELKKGELVLVAYGQITYTDAVRKRRFTRYCYLYDPANPTQLQVCAEGNVSN
jgi:hypothetical protein